MCSKVREKQNIVLSDQTTKRMRVSKATKRASETSEQTLHRQLISGTTHAQFAEGLHFSAFHSLRVNAAWFVCTLQKVISR